MAQAFTFTSLTAPISIARASKIAETPSLLQPACIALLAMFLLALPLSAQADEYQEAIAQAFPGFQILSRSEFTDEIQKTVDNPALAIGRFNGDKLNDFAAIIRGGTEKRYDSGPNSYDYYDGKLVVCRGLAGKKYQCQELPSRMPIILPFESYLVRVQPGEVVCYKDDGTKKRMNIKRDSIGWTYPDKRANVQFIFQLDGTYLHCNTTDH